MTYRNLKGGDRVTVRTPQGQELTGKVNSLLRFDSHVIIDIGGRHGTPKVANDSNIVRINGRKTQ